MHPHRILVAAALTLLACSPPAQTNPDVATDARGTDARIDASDVVVSDTPTTESGADAIADASDDAAADAAIDATGMDVRQDAVGDVPSDTRADAPDAFSCRRDIDCRSMMGATHCNPATGACVECVPFGDDCPTGSYCGSAFRCVPGCRDASDCGSSTTGMVCDVTTHLCVGCTSDSNCAAGTVCTSGTCVPGCNATHPCAAGQMCCSGTCIATQTDPLHCGSCTVACGTTNAAPACVAGACQENCSAGFGDCDGNVSNGCETDVSANSSNCGACGAVCRLNNATAMCGSSTCNIVSCSPGFRNCDGMASTGCESNPMTDVMNCGMCGLVCPTGQVCTGGTCACPAGTSSCPGGCLDLQSDVMNCGSCGTVCPTMQVCIAGACTAAPLYHGWTCPIAGCITTSYNTTATTALGGRYPYNTGDSNACRAWKLAATVCTTQPTFYSDNNNWTCPVSGGFTDPAFGTYCRPPSTQYACSTCPGACNATCVYTPLSLRNCSGSEVNQP